MNKEIQEMNNLELIKCPNQQFCALDVYISAYNWESYGSLFFNKLTINCYEHNTFEKGLFPNLF